MLGHIVRLVVIGAALIVGAAGPVNAEPLRREHTPRRLIVLIGDGMGFEALGLLRLYSEVVARKPSNFERALARGNLALMQPRPRDSLVTDSACAITELASGVEALPETLGLDEQGRRVESIAEAAKKQGLSVGLVSDTRITHATPAGLAAHVSHRSQEAEIAKQMLDSSFDVLFSGGFKYFLPAGAGVPNSAALAAMIPATHSLSSARNDKLNLLEAALSRGYQLAFDNAQLDRVSKPPVLGLFATSAMQDAIEEHRGASTQPSLAHMTRKALSLLEQNPIGFFAMVESGQIDWAEHSNDAGLLLHEMLRFDETLGVILDWMKTHPETTLVVTADHATGGFGFSYTSDHVPAARPFPAQPGVLYAPQHNFGDPHTLTNLFAQSISFARFFDQLQKTDANVLDPAMLQQQIKEQFHYDLRLEQARIISRNESFSALYSDPKDRRTALLARMLGAEFGIAWSSGGHTSAPVLFLTLGEKSLPAQKFMSATQAGQYLRATLLR